MKPNNNPKKVKKDFDPTTHWYSLLAGMVLVLFCAVAYSAYTFYYIQDQILLIGVEAQNNAQSASGGPEQSRQNKQFMKDINALNQTLANFAEKETIYNSLIKAPVISGVASSTASSTAIATSTK